MLFPRACGFSARNLSTRDTACARSQHAVGFLPTVQGQWQKGAGQKQPKALGVTQGEEGMCSPKAGAEKGSQCFAPEVGSISCPQPGSSRGSALLFLPVAALEEGQGGDKGASPLADTETTSPLIPRDQRQQPAGSGWDSLSTLSHVLPLPFPLRSPFPAAFKQQLSIIILLLSHSPIVATSSGVIGAKRGSWGPEGVRGQHRPWEGVGQGWMLTMFPCA